MRIRDAEREGDKVTPTRNVKDAEPGQVTATPNRILRRLAIRKLIVRGVRGRRR